MLRLADDPAAKAAALHTIRELLDNGLAGLDCYDPDIFCVDAPQPLRDHADVALDLLGAEFHRQGAYGAPLSVLQCRLPVWVRNELELNEPDAPTLVMPLASRGVSEAGVL